MNRFTFEEARSLASRVLDVIGPFVEKAEVAGSVRRNRDMVHDVDIVIIPKPMAFVWPTYLSQALMGIGGKPIRSGDKIMEFDIDGRQVDLYRASEDDWGIQLLRWTGSKEHNIMLCSRARRMGMKLAVSEGLIKDGKVIASKIEEDIFQALGLPFAPPEEREVN